jgi:UDPglucose--hexose-1-phosphate uridylyltransferase
LDVGEPGASATGVVRAPVADAPGSPGFGVAEVILECPQHETAFRNLSQSQATDVIRAWRDRLRFWRDDGRLAFAQVFKNEGPAAGASVEHCHSQLIGIPFVPPAVEDELRRVASGRCPSCDSNSRLGPSFVTESEHFLAACPIAPRFPGETWVLLKEHAGAFEMTPDDHLLDLVRILFDVLARMDRGFGHPDYNLIVRSAPFRYEGTWHWRIELLPRVTTTAGWEWGTGLLINTLFPEDAARLLRDAG